MPICNDETLLTFRKLLTQGHLLTLEFLNFVSTVLGITALTFLDLSADFDTIDPATLAGRLSDWYGMARLKLGLLFICKIVTNPQKK